MEHSNDHRNYSNDVRNYDQEDAYIENNINSNTESALEFAIECWNEVIVPHVESGRPVLNKVDLSSNVTFDKWILLIKNNLN